MKPGTRVFSIVAAIIALIAGGLSFWAGEMVNTTGKTGADAREATFASYRIAQSLKSLAAGYELTMNEFYSTVLEFPAYQTKSAAQHAEIERELAGLVKLQEGDASTAADLAQRFNEMEDFRQDLEGAMTGENRDWDRAREALFKLNVLSVQAIQQADFLGQSASERAKALDVSWRAQQDQSLLLLRITSALALLAGGMLLFGSLRLGRS